MINKETLLTQEILKRRVNYDAQTGLFTRLINCPNSKVGAVAGTKNKKYIHVGVGGRQYYAHRLAWLYMMGDWPEKEIDHIDGNAANNAWVNLREANRIENNRNKGPSARSGFKGVYTLANGKYVANICLGTFDTKEEAANVYREAALKLHGDFAHSSLKNAA